MATLSLPHAALYYEDSADASPASTELPVIFFLNGWALSARYWTPVIDTLSPQFRCVRFDQSGTGRTRLREAATSERFSIDAFIDEASELIEHLRLGTDAPIHIVGHSMGSMVAAGLARRYPDRAASLTITACGIFDYSAVQMNVLKWFVSATMSLKWMVGVSFLKQAFLSKATAQPISAEYAAIITDDFVNTDSLASERVGTLSLDRDALAEYASTLLSVDLPLLLLIGDLDKTIPPEGMTTLYRKRLQATSPLVQPAAEALKTASPRLTAPTTLVHFPALGHLPMLEDTPAFSDALRSMIETVTAGSASKPVSDVSQPSVIRQ